MLVLHEVHRLMGRRAEEFEDVYRNHVLGEIAHQDGVRLLWYLNHAVGSGPSYTVVTMTAIRDGASWEAFARRTAAGDLAARWLQLDEMRYEVTGKLFQPVTWSPMQDVTFDSVPTDGREHELSLYMEDTGWPTSSLDEYVDYWDVAYYRIMRDLPPEQQLLEVQACFQTAFGSHIRPEAMLMQKILDYRALKALLTSTEVYDPDTWPGTYMHGALKLRDQWESRLLRTSAWSPLH